MFIETSSEEPCDTVKVLEILRRRKLFLILFLIKTLQDGVLKQIFTVEQ